MNDDWKDTYFINPEYKCLKAPLKTGFWTEKRLAREPFNGSYNVMARIAAEHDTSGRTILDIGCGPATKIPKFFPDALVTGIDLPEAVRLAKTSNPNAAYLSCDLDNDGDIAAIMKETGIFDFILCIDVIEHVLYPEKILGLIRSRMDESSIAFISTLERDLSRGANSGSSGTPHAAHVREWNRDEFTRFVSHFGFRIFDAFITVQNARNPHDMMRVQTLCCRI